MKRKILSEAVLLLLAIPILLWTLLPIYHIFLFSISTKDSAFSGAWWPDKPTLRNFETIALEDPTCGSVGTTFTCPGSYQYSPESGGSGIGNVFQNSKWLVKVNGRVQLPYDFNLAANMASRQGFPFPQSILTPNRANGGGQAQVILDPMGDLRYENTFSMDLRVDRNFRFGTVTLVPALDIFNLTNAINPAFNIGAAGAGQVYTGTLANHTANTVFMKPDAFAGDAGQGEQRVAQLGFRITF